MADINVSGKSIAVNDEGFLLDPGDWSKEVAEVIAQANNIKLTDLHWKVIEFCRKDYEANGTPPGVRRITKVGGIPTKDMYQMFPGGPGKLAAKVSGLSKPVGCV